MKRVPGGEYKIETFLTPLSTVARETSTWTRRTSSTGTTSQMRSSNTPPAGRAAAEGRDV